MDEFTFVTRRREWIVEVVYCDHYGNDWQGKPLYEKVFPTRALAIAHLEEISYPHLYIPDRRVYKEAMTDCHNIRVKYHEREIDA